MPWLVLSLSELKCGSRGPHHCSPLTCLLPSVLSKSLFGKESFALFEWLSSCCNSSYISSQVSQSSGDNGENRGEAWRHQCSPICLESSSTHSTAHFCLLCLPKPYSSSGHKQGVTFSDSPTAHRYCFISFLGPSPVKALITHTRIVWPHGWFLLNGKLSEARGCALSTWILKDKNVSPSTQEVLSKDLINNDEVKEEIWPSSGEEMAEFKPFLLLSANIGGNAQRSKLSTQFNLW